ncbi:MAG: Hpt domain-containing protein [Cyanobacteria bacterium P01_D01_bin.105]
MITSRKIPSQKVAQPNSICPNPISFDFDWQQLKQLAGEDNDFEYELLEMFLQDAKQNLQALERAIATRSTQAIKDIAHSLRGASANVGACSMALFARQLEQVAHCGQFTEAHSLLRQITVQCEHIQSYLQAKQ